MINYYKKFEKITETLGSDEKPTLLLHSCCAPCSSASLETVLPHFDVDLFYYNPNITNRSEYEYRLSEEKRFVSEFCPKVKVFEGEYEPERFYLVAEGLEGEKEGGARCLKCYELRLKETAVFAKKHGYEFFASTLSVSPYKNSDALNQIGYSIQQEIGVKYLPTDFKKKNGYHRSIELSKEYGLYRQNYCGCEFSLRRDR